MKLLKKLTKVAVSFLTVFGLSLNPIASLNVSAEDGSGTKVVQFLAGQHIDVGTVTFDNDGTNLFITIDTKDGWTMDTIHIDIGSSFFGVGGAPGQFSSGPMESNGGTHFVYTVPLEDWDAYYIVVHAEVSKAGRDGGNETAYAKGTKNFHAWQMVVKYIPCPPDDYSLDGNFIKYVEENNGLVDISTVLDEITFDLFASDQTTWLATFGLDAMGELDTEGMMVPLGTYYLRENSTNSNYVIDTSWITITVTKEGTWYSPTSLTNHLVRNDIIIDKYITGSESMLAGVSFDLFLAGSDTPLMSGMTDEDGRLVFEDLPNGNYVIVETATVDGFVLDSTPIEVALAGEDAYVTMNNDREELEYFEIYIDKYITGTQTPLEGVDFNLYLEGSDAIIATGTTDENGELTFDDLLPGDYIVVEVDGVEGYVLDDTPIIVEIDDEDESIVVFNDRVEELEFDIVIDKFITGTESSLAGVTFDLYLEGNDVVLLSGITDANGRLVFEDLANGSYVVVERTTVEGYVLDSTPIEVTLNGEDAYLTIWNDPIPMGWFSMHKYDGNENYLDGAMFTITSLSDDSFEPLTFTTEEGYFGVELPYGTYTIVEDSAPLGYININSEPTEFVIEGEGSVHLDFFNPERTVFRFRSLPFIKVMEESLFEDAYMNVKFGIYASEEIVYLDDQGVEQTIAQGALIGEYGVKPLGNGSYGIDLPENTMIASGMYYIVEKATDVNYVLDDGIYLFEVDVDGQVWWYDATTQEPLDQTTLTVTNELKRFDLVLHKVDQVNNKALVGAEFSLYNEDKEMIMGTTFVTDSMGNIVFEDVSNGTYYVKESKAPTGYVLDATWYKVVIDNEDAHVTVMNKVKETIIPTSVDSNLSGYLGLSAIALAGSVFFLLRKKED